MRAWAAPVRRNGHAAWGLALRVLLILAMGALVYLVAQLAVAAWDGRLTAFAGAAPLAVGLAAVVYLAGHGFRILRLALLIGGWRVGFRDIASFHLMTAAVSLTAPLKLGEIYRVLEMSHIAGGLVRAVVIAWWERVFDVALILLMLILALSVPGRTGSGAFLGVAGIAAGFVLATAIAFFVVPDNLRRLSVLIIRRYDSSRAVPLLRLLDVVRRAILEAPALIRGKVPSIVALTALIWVCEIACFAMLLPALGGALSGALDALLSFLSALMRGETLLGVMAAGETGDISRPGLLYLAAAQAPLSVLGLLAGVHYVRGRLR